MQDGIDPPARLPRESEQDTDAPLGICLVATDRSALYRVSVTRGRRGFGSWGDLELTDGIPGQEGPPPPP